MNKDKDKAEFLGAMIAWCFRWGCEVRLRNIAQNMPIMTPMDVRACGEHHEWDRNGALVDMIHRTKHKIIEMPELVFSRGDRNVCISAHDWESLMLAFHRSHRRIYTELSVPMIDWDPGNKTKGERND